jgi:hypothetical protein
MTLDLAIAGRRIRLRSDMGVILNPDERFSAFIASDKTEPDLIIEVMPEGGNIPSGALKVFDAMLMEESVRGPVKTSEPFWEVMITEDTVYVRVWLKETEQNPLLVMPKGSMTWQIFADNAGPEINPLPYPLDSLIFYFLCSLHGEIMIHGSGVACKGRGWIFSGRSGSGKTTIAKIFDRNGDRVIHDDRLVLRKEGSRWTMHSTPVYRNDEPCSSEIDHLWIITHGRSNIASPVYGAEAAGLLLSNCIQHNWDKEAAERLMASVDSLVSAVKVSRLSFVPDDSIREYMLARQSSSFSTTAQAASSLLEEGKEVIITAGGYSMWPAIKPGDRVIITPFNREIPLAAGMVVALRRDGGFVVHRVAEFKKGKLSNFIRTQGDASMITDPWSTVMEVAGLVDKVTPEGDRQMVSPRRMPRFFAGIAVAVIQIIKSIAHSEGTKDAV